MRILILSILIAALICGCSGGSNPINPDETAGTGIGQNTAGVASHNLWGMWQFAANPDEGKLEVVPLREGTMHLNALQFLEPPPMANLTLESVEFNGPIVEVDIGLRHPFLGLNEFSGFDVAGVLITCGSFGGWTDPELLMAGSGDTRLLNPDGWTRWWNPAEFPVNNGTMFSYKDGLLGTPDAVGHYNSTLNAYKLFCDELTDPDMPVGDLSPESRCLFSAGMKNVRHYTLELGAGLIFNYAVDASWQFPEGTYPWEVPDDFGPNANKPEAWNIVITELENTLWNDGLESGGDLSLLIDVWDHYDAGLNTVWVDHPGAWDLATTSTPTGGGDGYSTYQIDIVDATPGEDQIGMLIGVECEATGYQELLPGKPVASYFMYTAEVDDHSPVIVCGEAVHSYDGQYLIQGISNWNHCQRADFTILEAGAHAGECVLKSWWDSAGSPYNGTFIRFDPMESSTPTGYEYFTLPGRKAGDPETNYVMQSAQVDQNPVNAHIGVINGRVFDTVQIVDEDGNHIEDVIVTDPQTPSGYYPSVPGMDFDGNGDLWLVTDVKGDYPGVPDPIWQLRHYELQSSSPFYVENEADRLDISGDLYNTAKLWYVTDIAISYEEDILFVFAATGSSIFVKYDISTSPPTKLASVDLLPFGISICSNPGSCMSRNDIEIDHTDPLYEKCRVLIMYQKWNGSSIDVYLMKIDTDFNVLADELVNNMTDSWLVPHAIAINTDAINRDVLMIDMHYSIPFNDFTLYTMPTSDW